MMTFADKLVKAQLIEKKINVLLKKPKSDKHKDNLLDQLNRLHKIVSQPVGKRFFLHEKKYTQWRELSTMEERVEFKELNEAFNSIEDDLEEELTSVVTEDMERALMRMQNRLKAGDIAGIAAIAFVSMNKLYGILNTYAKEAYEKGKKGAAKELKVGQPITPTKKTQLMNLDSDMIAEAFATDINLAAKEKARDGLLKGIGTAAVMAAITVAVSERAGRMITNITGSLVGENINKGRSLVFEANVTKIRAFERSELLDGRTCDMCISLDKRVVTADDPMSKMDLVHTNCRGIWVPVLTSEELPNKVGMPKTIVDSFETVGGVPSINAFKQLKKPINAGNIEAQDELRKRLAKKN